MDLYRLEGMPPRLDDIVSEYVYGGTPIFLCPSVSLAVRNCNQEMPFAHPYANVPENFVEVDPIALKALLMHERWSHYDIQEPPNMRFELPYHFLHVINRSSLQQCGDHRDVRF